MLKDVFNNKPIGVFDSGLGGLTVVKELMKQLPHESVVYFGDTARVPYGTKSEKSIIRFSHENTEVLLKHKVKMVVVACNSSSSYAMVSLKKMFDVPILGVIEPGAQRAVEGTQSGRVGVIATSATIHSQAYVKAIGLYNKKVKVFSQECPLFVPLAEEGWFRKKITEDIAQEYLEPLKRKKIDTLILGCTHYPLLKNVLQKVMGKNVVLVDSAKVIIGEVKKILEEQRFCASEKNKKKDWFLVSDRPQAFAKIAKNFLGKDISQEVKYV